MYRAITDTRKPGIEVHDELGDYDSDDELGNKDDDHLNQEQDDYVPVYHPPQEARETQPELPRTVTRMGMWS